MKKKKTGKVLAAKIASFMKHCRKTANANKRSYIYKLEIKIQKMNTAELDKILHGEY